MRKNNKGITPLIATVLLIGFTVALAAIIMTWGTDFIKGTTANVDKQRDVALLCTSQLDFQIKEPDCNAGKVSVDNRGAIDITALKLRLHKIDGTVTVEDKPGIAAFGVTPFDVTNLHELKKIEAIATVKTKDNTDIVCSTAVREAAVNCPTPSP